MRKIAYLIACFLGGLLTSVFWLLNIRLASDAQFQGLIIESLTVLVTLAFGVAAFVPNRYVGQVFQLAVSLIAFVAGIFMGLIIG